MTPPRATGATVVGLLIGGLVHLGSLLNFTWDLGRTTLGIGFASDFFDTQATALREGRLAVPDGSMGIEGFIHDGQTFMYFGPFPSMLRIPVQHSTTEFNGQLTLLSMLVAWIVLAVMATRLTWLVRHCFRPDAPLSRTDSVLGATVIALITGGTSLTYNNALPWAYHEIYAWQTALAITAAYLMVRIALQPDAKLIAWLAAVATAAALTRTTGGWGIALGGIALGVWFLLGRSTRTHRRYGWWVVGAGAVALLAGVIVNYAKFEHIYMFPLDEQVWTQVNDHRRVALEANGGTLAGAQFFWTSLATYFSPTAIRFVDYFPWITFPADPPTAVGDVVLDQTYRMGSLPTFMPLLLLLTVLALIPLLRRPGTDTLQQGIRALRAGALALVLMTGGVMAYGYLAYRYTGDFVPALMLGAIVGTWGVVRPLLSRWPALTAPIATLMIAATAWSMVANTAVGFSSAALLGGGRNAERYVSLANDLSGGPGTPFARTIHTGAGLPPDMAPADTLWVRGKCDGLYLATGDAYTPWIAVVERTYTLRLLMPRELKQGTMTLATLTTPSGNKATLQAQTTASGRLRFITTTPGVGRIPSDWITPAPMEDIHVRLATNTSTNNVEITSTPGGRMGYIATTTWSPEWITELRELRISDQSGQDEQTGITLRQTPGPDPATCTRLLHTNEVPLS